MTTANETEPRTDTATAQDDRVEQACHHLLETFVAVCEAPDDTAVADAANTALRELETLLT
jgi:hypothetical protein